MQMTKTSLLLGSLALLARAQDDSACDPLNADNNDATCTGSVAVSTAYTVPSETTNIPESNFATSLMVFTTAESYPTGVRGTVLAGSALPAAATGSCSAGYNCPIQPTSQDAATLTYAYAIQNLLVQWYDQYTFSASDFSAVPMADTTQSNGESYAANSATNFAGLKQQAQLGLEAIQQLGQIVPGFSMPTCDYTLPPGLPNATAAIMSATLVEATLCGAFIGAADYAYHPAVANLMARLAAEHGIHGSYLQGFTMPVQFMASSMSLTPAFNPEQIMSSGMGVGYLGDFIPQGCVAAPAAPCGGTITFGSLLPSTMGATSGAATGAATASATYGQATGGATYYPAPNPYAAGTGNGAVATTTMTSNGVEITSTYNPYVGVNGTGAAGASYTGPVASQTIASYTGAAAAATGVRGFAGAVGAGIAALAML